MSNVFIYCAALYCEGCGEDIRDELAVPEGHDPAAERTGDSEDYPQGPYAEGGGESDTPQHCEGCGEHLGNPLTQRGYRYVADAILAMVFDGEGDSDTLEAWSIAYPDWLEGANLEDAILEQLADRLHEARQEGR